MLNQSFSHRNFKRLFRTSDLYKYDFGATSASREKVLEDAATDVCSENFAFSKFNLFHFAHGDAIAPNTIAEDFAIRKLNDNIKRVFSVKTADRNRIVPQVKILLGETGEFWLYKLDIKRFFESINKTKILEIVLNDARLSFQSKRLIKNLFYSQSIKDLCGLPRGLSLSSTLAEIYMQEFDNFCRTHPQCYYYTRYVDDIIIMFHENPSRFLEEAKSHLPMGLDLNSEKTAFMYRPKIGCVEGLKKPLTFLGYEFSYDCSNKKKAAVLTVGMSEKKIKRIKTRIAISLFEFTKSKNIDLLCKRIRFLSSNFKIEGEKELGNLYAGIYFNNLLIDQERLSDLKNLDEFLRKCVYAKNGSLGKRLNNLLTPSQKSEICGFSFVKGFECKAIRNFQSEDLYQIRSAWIYAQ